MASKDPDEPFNTETDEETVAMKRKRARRVSFADREITSVHIFNRDEDYETPQQHSSARRRSSDIEVEVEEEVSEVVRFFGDLAADSDDSKGISPGYEDEGGDDDDEIAPRKPFLRPMEWPSPGSSTIGGSATSNNEDNFFGPVSASFIRPGRLSDSAASDTNPDITMDSTAFSMHFRSLVRSESGDLKTPTGVRMGFEEKTPFQAGTPSDLGNFMELTKAKKPISQISSPVGKVSGSRDSNDMSLVGDNPHRYDYGRLSPTVEAILAKGSEDMCAVSIFGSAFDTKPLEKSEVSIFQENGCGRLDIKDNRGFDMCNFGPDDVPTEGVSGVNPELGEVNAGSSYTLLDQITHYCPSNRIDDQIVDVHVDHQIQSPNQLNRVNNKFIKDVSGSMLNVEFSAVGSNTPPNVNVNSNVRLLGLFSQNEHADVCPTEDALKKSSPKYGTHNSHIDELLSRQPGSPSAGSITSLSAKRRQIFQDTTNSSRHLLYATPSSKFHVSILRKESVKLGESLSSIQKSNSEFKIIESSTQASTLRDGIEKSKLRLLQHLSSEISPLNNVVEETSKDLQRQHASALVKNLEKDFFNADKKIEEHKDAMNMDGAGSGTPKNVSSLNQNEESRRIPKDGESLDHLSNFAHVDEVIGMMTAVASPTQLTRLGMKAMKDPLMSKIPLEGTSFISASDSPIMEVGRDHSKDHKPTNDPYKFVSPVKRLDKLLSSAVEYHENLSDLKQQDQYKKLANGSGLDENSTEYAPTSDSHLTEKVDKLDSLVVEQRMQSCTPLLKISYLKDITQVKRAGNKELFSPDRRNSSKIIRNFQTPSNDMDLLKYHSGSPYKNLQIRSDSTQDKDEFPGEGTKASVSVPASPYEQRSLKEPSRLKSPSNKLLTQIPAWQEPTWSPSRKELCDFTTKDHMDLLVGKDGHGNDDYRQGHHNSQRPLPLQDFENSSSRKRRSEEIVLGNADNINKEILIQRSPKFHKSGDNNFELMLKHSSGSNNSYKKTGDDTTMKHWTDIFQQFSTVTNQILSPLIDKLNIRAIDILEDILVHLQKVDKYLILSSEILSQRTYNQSDDIRHKRVAETKLLVFKIVYEKAKLQIMHMKHEKLLKRRQLLSSGIQKSQILKLNYVRHLSGPDERDTHVDNNHHDSSLVKVEGKREVAIDKVTSMRQVVETLDRKIKNIVKSCPYGKMKGEPSYAKTILSLNDHLKKKMLCRSICQDVQLWEIDDLERRNGHHILVLNYCGFICQRYMIGDSAASMISNKVNESNITKNFPNMDACTVFSFVFAAESTKKSIGSKSLVQETQTTSSLLLNLLNVVEEVQLARIEIRSLTQTIFNSPHVDQLDLQLGFIDFDSGRKVTANLDMTCLNRGVYPSEILPHQLHIPTMGTQKTQPESLLAEIKVAIDNLPIGYSRIIRLCRRVSEVLQSSNR